MNRHLLRPCSIAIQHSLLSTSVPALHTPDRLAGFYTAILDPTQPRTPAHLVHAPNVHIAIAADSPVEVAPVSSTANSGTRSITVPTATLSTAPTTSVTPVNAVDGLHGPSSSLAFAEPAPTQPDPPDNCCMSGCTHCVWNLYVDDYIDFKCNLRAWHGRRFKWIQSQLEGQVGGLDKSTERQLLEWMAADAKGMVDPGSAEAEQKEALAVMDPTVRVFWEMENQLNRDSNSN